MKFILLTILICFFSIAYGQEDLGRKNMAETTNPNNGIVLKNGYKSTYVEESKKEITVYLDTKIQGVLDKYPAKTTGLFKVIADSQIVINGYSINLNNLKSIKIKSKRYDKVHGWSYSTVINNAVEDKSFTNSLLLKEPGLILTSQGGGLVIRENTVIKVYSRESHNSKLITVKGKFKIIDANTIKIGREMIDVSNIEQIEARINKDKVNLGLGITLLSGGVVLEGLAGVSTYAIYDSLGSGSLEAFLAGTVGFVMVAVAAVPTIIGAITLKKKEKRNFRTPYFSITLNQIDL